MASYPGSIPSLPRPSGSTQMDATGFTGSGVIDGISDEIEAIATELGTNPRGGSASVKARLDALDTTVAGKETAGAAAAAQAAAIAASQPLDSDLTAIAALSTTSFGRSLLALADAAAGRTALGLGTAATQAATAFDAAGAAAAAQAASQPLDSDLTAIAALSTTSYGRALLALADAAALTALGNTFTSSLKGLAPASGGGTSNFLRADGTWAAPAGGGGTAFTKGTAAPSGGSDGDWYLRTTYGQLYQKVSGTWTIVENTSAGSIALTAGAGSNFTSAGGWSANQLGCYVFSGDATQTGALFNTKVGSPTIGANSVTVASATLSGAYATAAISGTRELGAVFGLTTLASSGRTLYIGLGLGFGNYPWPYVGITNAGAMTLYSGGGTSIKTLSGTMDATGRVVMKMVTGAVLIACLSSTGVILDQALFASPYVTAGYLTSLGGAKVLVGGDGVVGIEALEVMP